MINLLSLFTGSRKKSGAAAQATAASKAPVPAVPRRVPTSLEERQHLLAHHVRLVARGMANGLCVYGSRGGLGKTRVVLATLKEEGVEPVVLTGHCTPLAMYMSLYEHPQSVVFLDDCDAMFRILPALGILRSALWEGEKGSRLVNYNSSQLKVPSSFRFEGRIVFAVNTLPTKNYAFQAVLSRVDQFELSASNEEVLDLMRQLATQGFEGKLTADECQEVVDFVSEFSATRELSVASPGAEPAESPLRAGRKAWTGGSLSPASSTRSAGPPLRRSAMPVNMRWSACSRFLTTIPTASPTKRRRGGC